MRPLFLWPIDCAWNGRSDANVLAFSRCQLFPVVRQVMRRTEEDQFCSWFCSQSADHRVLAALLHRCLEYDPAVGCDRIGGLESVRLFQGQDGLQLAHHEELARSANAPRSFTGEAEL